MSFQTSVNNQHCLRYVREAPLLVTTEHGATDDVEMDGEDDFESSEFNLDQAYREHNPADCEALERMTSALVKRYPRGAVHLCVLL